MRATVETLAVIAVVFLLQLLLGVVGLASTLVLSAPLTTAPWALATGVYAHAGLGHLFTNAVGLLIAGPLVERRTTRPRFHLFFLGSGALAGVAEVTLGGLIGPAPAVLGASGAVFALFGYLLAGNVVSATLFDRLRLSARAQVALFLAVAVAMTLATAAPGVALIAHATGLLIGLVAGRLRLLDA
ncbi:rhomboid family intramembrane serine protease [Haloparvum sedimenti]|uniref:rhomboid family intramembrane serine protease n=1 Tax=Haloparvum sedimenti TaxID=1678448 RepID=UPI00071E992B|nr:rhomboid family intramembrane serine protease [Haloparvum sedimenti]